MQRALFHQLELLSAVFLRICAYLRILVIGRDQPPLHMHITLQKCWLSTFLGRNAVNSVVELHCLCTLIAARLDQFIVVDVEEK